MSKDSEVFRDLESINSIKDSQEYKDFYAMAMNMSNLGVATAVISGILRTWCSEHDENFVNAIILMGISHTEANNTSKKLKEDLQNDR